MSRVCQREREFWREMGVIRCAPIRMNNLKRRKLGFSVARERKKEKASVAVPEPVRAVSVMPFDAFSDALPPFITEVVAYLEANGERLSTHCSY